MDEKLDIRSSFTALQNKVVFIHHVKGSKLMTQVMDVVRRLHGELSEFFDNRVDIVITNQNDGALPRRSDNAYLEASSPASSRGTNYDYIRSSPLGTPFAPSSSATQTSSLSQPSPLNSNSPYSSQSSPFAALSPGGGSGGCSQKYPSKALQSSTLSRGQRMTMLARNAGSVDGILEKAMRRKICILTNKDFWRWFHSLPTEIQVYCEECLPHIIVEDKKLDQNAGVKPIRPPCLKVISLSQPERSFYVESTHFEPQLWPAEDFVATRGGSPAEAQEPADPEAPVKKLSAARNAALVLQKRWKHRIPKGKKKNAGKINICEACHGSYNNLNKHLKSDKHGDFVAKADEHFLSVDQVLASLPDLVTVIATAKERQNFMNQQKAKRRSGSVESRKSIEKSADSEGAEKDCDHINHDVLSTGMINEASSAVPEDAGPKKVCPNDMTENKPTPVDRVATDGGVNNDNAEIDNLDPVSKKSQCVASNLNGHEKIANENAAPNLVAPMDENLHSCEHAPDAQDSHLDKKAPEQKSCPNGKEFVHEVDLDLSPIKDCEICQEPSVLLANSSVVHSDENTPVFHRSIFATDSYNSPWDNLVYRNLESDCYSGHLHGFSRSATQSLELQEPQISVSLLQTDLSYLTPLSNVGPFANSSPYSIAPLTNSQLPNIIESTPTKAAPPKAGNAFSAIPLGSQAADATKVTPNKDNGISFSSPIRSKDGLLELLDKPTRSPSLKESNNDDSAFLESPFAVSRPPLRGRFFGPTSSPRRRHSTRLFVRMGGQVSPQLPSRAGTPEMECRFAFCSNCDAFHLKPEAACAELVTAAVNSESCLSSSPVMCSPRARVRGRLLKSPRRRLKLDDDAENSGTSDPATASPAKRTRVLSECQMEPCSASPPLTSRKRPHSFVNGIDVKDTLLRHVSDQLLTGVESPNKDVAKSTSSTKNRYASPRRKRTKK